MPYRSTAFGFAVLCYALALPAAAQIPGIPRPPRVPNVPGVDLPGVEDLIAELLREDPPLTTSLADATAPVPWLDWFDPQVFDATEELLRTETGAFQLAGGCYRFAQQSFCLRPGTHGPSRGSGYVLAQLQGSKAHVIRTILQQAGLHPDVPQRDLQLLLWGILSRTRLSAMDRPIRDAAAELLPEDMVRALNAQSPLDALSDATGQLPARARQKLLAELPRELRQVYSRQLQIRSLLMRRGSSFEDIERLAVLLGDPDDEVSVVPRGRWSRHPAGYFLRFQSSHYSKTTIDVLTPRPSRLVRDALGRITTWDLGDGWRVETAYDDTIAPLLVPASPDLKGYAFRAIRWIAPDLATPGGSLVHEVLNQGWTFVGDPRPPVALQDARLPAPALHFATLFSPSPAGPLLVQDGDGPFGGWHDRYEDASGAYESYEDFRESYERATGERSESDIDDLGDTDHYRDGLDAARGSESDRLNWLRNHFERQAAALAYATCVLSGECDPPGADGESGGGGFPAYDPSGTAAVPGSSGRQRLGMSGR